MKRPACSTEEVWSAIRGLEGSYEVSSLGSVRSLDRLVVASNGVERRYRGRMLQPSIAGSGPGSKGYRQVVLPGYRTVLVSSLVAEAFLGPRRGRVVRHADGDTLNDRADNLEYGVRQQAALT